MPLPRGHSYLLAWLFAADRMDTWVLKVSIAIPLVCIAGLGLWHLMVYLAGKLPKKPRTVRYSPEPPSSIQSRELLPRGRALTKVAPTRDSPEQLQQACTDLEDSLAETYLALAESWMRSGQPQRAAAALKKILQVCPERRQAQLARNRLQQIGNDVEDHHS
ncbi:MAG: hypothetical protein ABSH35_15130 [Isosphaeraceae bacterium]